MYHLNDNERPLGREYADSAKNKQRQKPPATENQSHQEQGPQRSKIQEEQATQMQMQM